MTNDHLINVKKISNLQVSTFMIQNPYSYKSLIGVADVHNSGNHNVILGVYGSLYDSDKYKKIEGVIIGCREITRKDIQAIEDKIKQKSQEDRAFYQER